MRSILPPHAHQNKVYQRWQPLCITATCCSQPCAQHIYDAVQASLTAKAFYCGDDKVGEATRMVTRMSGGYAGGGGGPGSSPPDLPSLLLDARICYIGMPVSFWLGVPLSFIFQHAAVPLSCAWCTSSEEVLKVSAEGVLPQCGAQVYYLKQTFVISPCAL